ncbi:MAG: 50S ribosomal protein L30 [Bacteroidales bacterium]|nr:50S ribosomal protein L30 [Bacteroidales bacterium]MCM1415457.1 50S ribosomal protein L30 [bacterium]MCM1423503.1 50S ribosomal protein L30 [bacterium]
MAAKKEAAKMLKITLVRSTIGQVPKARATAKAMGFKKLNQTVELPDNASTRGQIQRIRHMVKVEEA